MKLPSLRALSLSTREVVGRFPLETCVAALGTGAAIAYEQQPNGGDDNETLLRLMLSCILALPLLLSISIYSERRQSRGVVPKIAGTLIAVALFFFLRPIEEVSGFRFAFLFVAFHLLVSFASNRPATSLDDFWEFNKRLFLRILEAGLYSIVLFAGLTIALTTTDALFGLDFDEHVYFDLFCVIAGLFNTLYFLSGVPKTDLPLTFPKGLKVFTQFVLIPLATIYLGILLVYELKIIVGWRLPEGLVSYLVLGYSCYGILSILLVFPIRNNEANRWIRIFSRWFYLLLIPLIVLLYLAIWIRVASYGVTESRYILIVLSLWLTGLIAYFLLSRKENIRIIPVSLCLVALLATWGPQSATAVSRQSQFHRILNYFASHHGMEDGRLVPLGGDAGSKGYALVQFYVGRYGADAFRPVLRISLDSLFAADTTHTPDRYLNVRHADALTTYLGLINDEVSSGAYYEVESRADSFPVVGYRYVYPFASQDTELDSSRLTLKHPAVSYDLQGMIDSLAATPGESRSLTVDARRLTIASDTSMLVLRRLNFWVERPARHSLQYAEGVLFVK